MRKKLVTLGEILLRLSPKGHLRFIQSDEFDVQYGGSEANIAATIAGFGMPASFVTTVPNNSIGESAIETLRKNNVHTGYINRGPADSRLGIYFAEKGHSLRSSQIIYDRANSAFIRSKISDYDFDLVFSDANWFHVSGITAALSKDMFELTKIMMKEAKERGLIVSCDLNYRASLWDFQKAREKMAELAKDIDVLFGIEPLSLLDEDGNDFKDVHGYVRPYDFSQMQPVFDRITNDLDIKYIAMTSRKVISASHNVLRGYLYNGKELLKSPVHDVEIIDRIGGGDAFAAGMIYALNSEKYTDQECVDFASATFALKHTIEGDIALLTLDEVENLMNAGSTEIVR